METNKIIMLSFCYNCSKKLEKIFKIKYNNYTCSKITFYKCKNFETLPDKITINFKILFLSYM